jgi:hypothetical protein
MAVTSHLALLLNNAQYLVGKDTVLIAKLGQANTKDEFSSRHSFCKLLYDYFQKNS